MKAIILKHTGGIENLVESEIAQPSIKKDEVLVQVKAIGINPVDATVRSNEQFLKYVIGDVAADEPVILGWDISGTVTEVGENVTKFKKGDEVFGMVNFKGHGKAYAEYVAASESHLALKPANVSHTDAAAASLAALTAWQSLVTYAKVKQGDRVLIHAAAGGVGHYAVQIAKHLGAYVIGTGSAGNKDFILGLGADKFIDYQNQLFEDVITDADVILDSISLTHEHIYRSVKALKNGGRLISILAHFNDDFKKALAVKDIYGYRHSVESSGGEMEKIARLLENGNLKSHVSDVLPFDKIGVAHLQMESGKTRGKVVVEL